MTRTARTAVGGQGIGRRRFLRTLAGGMAAAPLARGLTVLAQGQTRPAQKRAPRNLIFIVADTFRADHLGCYGSTTVKTPNLDRFATEATLFTNAYADGLPTIPCRRVYHTGRSIVPMRKHGGWIPLKPGRKTLAQVLRRKGFVSSFIVDTYHHFKPGMNFHHGFQSWQWIRGQETDRWRSGPAHLVDPKKHMPAHLWSPGYDRNMRQYLMNTRDFKGEDDYFCARTFAAGLEWLKRNAGKRRLMLWLDTFDPHEPWDAPRRFQEMYFDKYPAERTMFGYGVRHGAIKPEDLPFIRALYAAECSFVDDRFGKLMEGIRKLGLLDDTAIVFTTDHGTHLGEEGCVQKTAALLNTCVARLPLLVRHPDPAFAGKRVDALVGGADYMATLLDLLGVEHKLPLDGRSVWPVVRGEAEAVHDHVITEFGPFAAVRDHQWAYFQNTRAKGSLGAEFVKQRAAAIGKGARGVPHLYELAKDPQEKANVVLEHPEVVGRMQELLKKRLVT